MAWAHAGHFDQALVNASTGVPLASTSYQVFQTDGVTAVTIYNNRTRSSTVSQPLTTSAQGNAEFYCDPQSVIISVGSQTLSTDVYPDVVDLGALLNAALTSGDNDFNNHVISDGRMLSLIKAGSYSMAAADSLATITYNNASAGTFTLPNNLPVGWQIAWRQKGSGQITFSPASGASLENANNHTKSRAAYARGGLEVVENTSGTAAVYSLFGDTSA